MSTYWFLYCVDCNESTDSTTLELNHGENELRALWDAREKIAAVGTLTESVLLKVERYGDPLPVWFFVKHKDHLVRVKNEYGQFFGDCSKRLDCKCCGTKVWCNQPEGHDGACARTKPGALTPNLATAKS